MKLSNIAIILLALIFTNGCGDEIFEEVEQDNWIGLPENSTLGDTTEFSVSSWINGSVGGSIELTKDFSGGPFGQYCIYAKLLILPDTFPGSDSINFNLVVDAEKALVSVLPVQSNFTKPLKLTLTYCGLDLSGLNVDEIDFKYSNGTDTFVDIFYEDALKDSLTGTLQVNNAHIEYFPNPIPNGKYGWVRKSN
jgi:hypothetical protein